MFDGKNFQENVSTNEQRADFDIDVFFTKSDETWKFEIVCHLGNASSPRMEPVQIIRVCEIQTLVSIFDRVCTYMAVRSKVKLKTQRTFRSLSMARFCEQRYGNDSWFRLVLKGKTASFSAKG